MKRLLPLLLSLLLLCACAQSEYKKGCKYLEEGNAADAISTFSAVIDKDPMNADAYIKRGDAYLLLEEEFYKNSARHDYETALTLDPDSEEALTKLNTLKSENFYKQLPESFVFASGVGGWSTDIEIAEDGAFTGSFHDSDMGDAEEAYPNGTIYYCAFSGRFEDLCFVNEYTRSARVTGLTLEKEPEITEIEDDVRYISSTPYGINDGDEIYFYLPGTPLSDLPAEYVEWISMPMAWGDDNRPDTLPFWGLYNVTTQEGFFS